MNDNKRWMNPVLNRKLMKALKAIEFEGIKYLDSSGKYAEPNFGVNFVHHVWDALHIVDKCQEWYNDLYYSGFPESVRNNVFDLRFNFLGAIRYFLSLMIDSKNVKGCNRFIALGEDGVPLVAISENPDSASFAVCSNTISEIYGASYRYKYKGSNLVKFLTDFCSSVKDTTVDGEEVVVFSLSKAMSEFIGNVKKDQEINYKEYVG